MRSATDEPAFDDADVRFHAAVAAASGNRMLAFLVEGMEGLLRSSFPESLRGFRSSSPDLSALVRRHEEVYPCMRERDSVGAAAAMRRHLQATRTELRVALTTSRGLQDLSDDAS